jgi:hypothetical protein
MRSSNSSLVAVVSAVLLVAGCSASPTGTTDPASTAPGGAFARGGTHPFAFGDVTKPCYKELFNLYNVSATITGTRATSASGLQKLKDGLRLKANDAYSDMSKTPPKAGEAQQKMTDYDTKILSEFAGNKLSAGDLALLRGATPEFPPAKDSPLGASQGCIATFQ